MTTTAGATEAAELPWGVGCYEGPEGRVPWLISHDEIRHDMGAAHTRLEELGIGSGQRVLWCSLLSESGQFWPFIVGTMLRGAQLSCADATEGDAVRVAMFLRLMRYEAVLGVDDDVLDGLEQLGHDLAALFDGVRVIGARPGAYERLAAVGLTPHRFVLCGPALCLGDEPGAPARPMGSWQLDVAADDRVLVTASTPRATTFDRTPTAVHGAVADGAVVPHPPERLLAPSSMPDRTPIPDGQENA